jgi:Flp pilus assembly protein TadD/peroxiredoxin
MAGQPRTLASLRGKPALLSFWTAHSPASQQDLQIFNKIHATSASNGLQLLTINVDNASDAEAQAAASKLSFPVLRGSDDVAGIYNILYRYVYDRRRDLTLPTSFLINDKGDIVKIYQGPLNPEHVEQDFQHIPQTTADRLAKALPFPGVTDTQEFGRNYLSYGSVYFQRGYFDQAEVFFRRALSDDPSSAEALYGLGSVYLNNGKTTEARDCFDRATKLHSSYPDTLPNAWNNLGLIAARDGRSTEAIEYFQESLRLSPDHVIALDNLGSVYRQLKHWEQARRTFTQALAINPKDPEANYGLGMVFAQNNDTGKAEQYLKSALQSRPAYPEALNNLGILYLRTERRDQAVAIFEECIHIAPGFDQSYLNLARVYTVEGAPEKARAILQFLLKQNPNHPQAQQMLNQLPH